MVCIDNELIMKLKKNPLDIIGHISRPNLMLHKCDVLWIGVDFTPFTCVWVWLWWGKLNEIDSAKVGENSTNIDQNDPIMCFMYWCGI